MKKTLLLVDGSSYLYRAYHVMKLTAPDGQPTGAIYGVLNMLKSLSKDVEHDLACCVFDAKGKNFRHDLYPEYKSNRPPMPDDLRPQANRLPELVALMGWSVLSIEGVEADDVIGTLAQQAEKAGYCVVISTGDKDLAQLVNDNITLVDTMKSQWLDIQGVINKYGVKPSQIIDYLALIGDNADNIPGVHKCGEKTATKWLAQYHTLDNLIAHSHEIKGKIGEYLQQALPQLPLSRELITLKTDVELPLSLDSLQRQQPNWDKLIPIFQELGFRTWLKEAQEDTIQINSSQIDQSITTNYQTILDTASLQKLCDRLKETQSIAIDTETTSLEPLQAKLVGISIALSAGEAVYIPVGHNPVMVEAEQLPINTVLTTLKPFLEDRKLGKIGQNIKYDQHVLANYNIQLNGIIGDAMIASYLVESHLGHGLDEMAQRHLNLTTIKYEDLCGKGAKQISFADVSIDKATPYACQDADFAYRIETILTAQMDKTQQHLYHQLELPIAQVLFTMERTGVLIDKHQLAQQSQELGQQIYQVEEKIFEITGQKFNPNSTKQLREILFDKLGIPTEGVKKTPKGELSTNEAVLVQLAKDYPLPKYILQNRELVKLKTTYTDKLPKMINPQTGRVHTTYAQTVVNTGRLASNNPNLQQIPIRTPQGRQIRSAFIADKGKVIISADYSQIELRIMAHLSGDETLINAFVHGEDIHRRTASEVFNVAPEHVTAEQRRYAKTINFGLIYGMGSYGLAQALDIDTSSAKQFMARYFERYPKVAEYMEQAKVDAQAHGFVETLYGRRLYLPKINSRNKMEQAGVERVAINAPMQGTASDLIKRAMLCVYDWIRFNQLESRLIMQIHDELVLEVPQDECELVKHELPTLMASVGDLRVPLLAEVGVGENWETAH